MGVPHCVEKKCSVDRRAGGPTDQLRNTCSAEGVRQTTIGSALDTSASTPGTARGENTVKNDGAATLDDRSTDVTSRRTRLVSRSSRGASSLGAEVFDFGGGAPSDTVETAGVSTAHSATITARRTLRMVTPPTESIYCYQFRPKWTTCTIYETELTRITQEFHPKGFLVSRKDMNAQSDHDPQQCSTD